MRPLLILLVRGQYIDRRILYVLLMFVVSLPLLINFPVPKVAVLPQARQFYKTVEEIAADPVRKDKLVILCTNYGSGTSAENQTQTEAVMRHLMRKHLKFALLAFSTAQGRDLGKAAADAIAPKYSYRYGTDYVQFGYRPADAIEPLLKAAVRDIPGAFGNDINGTPLAQVPVMQNIKTVNDIGLIVEVASSQHPPNMAAIFPACRRCPDCHALLPHQCYGPGSVPFAEIGAVARNAGGAFWRDRV